MIRRRSRVYGGVQGVGFRVFVRGVARRLGLAGWVTNLADGSVEVEAEGAEGAVNALSEALHRGPPGAHVSRVEDVASGTDDLPEPFTIR
jgi:acylphosphatase